MLTLHTNEDVEPHTKVQLKYIEELKKKHGIDYDSHGSTGLSRRRIGSGGKSKSATFLLHIE